MLLNQVKRVLVTGSDGFIGSHLVQRLLASGVRVRAFVYYNSFNSCGWLDTLDKHDLDGLDIFAGDVRDPGCVRRAMADCEVVFHLAALISIPYSYCSPESFVETNVKGTLNVLEAAKDLNVAKVVTTSTSEVYGTAQRIPIDESHPLQAQSPYAATKIAADQIALSYHRSFGTSVAIVRPFNTFGPRQSLRAVIPTVITQAASGVSPIRLGALAPTRDFNFVEDTVDAFIKVGESDACIGEVLNAGSGRETSIGDVAAVIAKLMDRSIEIFHDDERLRPESSEVYRLVADSGKLHRLTGWRPTHSLEEGLAKTITWFMRADHLSRYVSIHSYNI